MSFFKRTVPVLIAFVFGLWFAIQYYIPTAWSNKTLEYASNWDKILVGFAYALGLYSLCHLHWRRIRRAQPGFGYSILVYVGLGTMLYFGLAGEARQFAQIVLKRAVAHHTYVLGWGELPAGAAMNPVRAVDEQGKPKTEAGKPVYEPGVSALVVDEKIIGYAFDPGQFACNPQTMRVKKADDWLEKRGTHVVAKGETPPDGEQPWARLAPDASWYAFASYQGYEKKWGGYFDWQYKWVYSAAQSAMFSMLAFFIASAAYRTFRARTWEAAFLLLAALVVIFGRTTLAGAVNEVFPDLAEWVMQVPNLGAKRGILLGVALGSVATALRIIFGIERAYLGGD